MSVHELTPRVADVVPEFALAALDRWAREQPLKVALRHPRQGAWRAWRWIDVQREVEQRAAALGEQGVGPQHCLVLCGALQPTLLILALAARRLGARSVVLGAQVQGDTLRRELLALRADFALLQRRETVAQWRASRDEHSAPLTVFCAQASAVSEPHWRVVPLAALSAAEPMRPALLRWASLARDPVVWVDEGTEWHEGLGTVLQRWLHRGDSLAFPETRESAHRDRQFIEPTSLLLSAERARQLAAEIEERLPAPGTWRRRLCDWTLSDPRQGPRRWIKARVRRLLGFARVLTIEVPSSGSVRSDTLSWAHDGVERAA